MNYLVAIPLILSAIVQRVYPGRSGVVYNNNVHFQPPGYVFAIVWTTLYILLGFYLSSLVRSRDTGFGKGDKTYVYLLSLFVANMIVNLAWMPMVNTYGKKTLGIFMIAFMLLLTFTANAIEPDPTRRAMLAPYATWLIVAMLLNVELARPRA